MLIRTALRTRSTGYTILELVVSVAILAAITTLTLVSRSAYQNSVTLTNLTYDVGLALREAQVYGINVRRETNTGIYTAGYGIRFKYAAYTSQTEASINSFLLFADVNNDRKYDSVNDKVVREYKIPADTGRVWSLCARRAGQTACQVATILNITFRRPDPDACITYNDTALDDGVSPPGVESSSYCVSSGMGAAAAQITLRSVGGAIRRITIYDSGEISVTENALI